MIHFIGSVVRDFILKVDEFPPIEESSYLLSVKESFGGPAGNSAFVASRLGADVTLIAPVGSDFHDSAYEKHLERAGVRLALFYTEDKTSTAFMVNNKKGQQKNFFYWGASEHFPEIMQKGIGSESQDIVHVCTGHPSLAPLQHEHLSFDPGKDTKNYDSESLEQTMKNVKFLFPNEFELQRMEDMLGKPILEFFDHSLQAVIVTKGSKGSEIITEKESFSVPAFPIDLVDPTGCGDAYSAAFLTAMEEKKNLEQCALFASSVASFVAEADGPQGGVPTKEKAIERVELL